MLEFRRSSVFLPILVFLCALTLIASAFLHDIIPHEHGLPDTHGHTQESPIWQDLHSALQHDKKSFALLTEVFFLLVLSISVPLLEYVFFVNSRALLYDPVVGSVLRRGIAPHRRFR